MSKPVVLIVDPNPVRRNLIFSTLALRWSPLVCSSGDSAIQIVDSQPISAVLISLGQHNDNGLAVCQTIRAHPKGRDLFTVVYGQPSGPSVSEKMRAKLQRTGGVDRFLVREVQPVEFAALLAQGLRVRVADAPATPRPPAASGDPIVVRSARVADAPELSWQELLAADASPEVVKQALTKEITWGELLREHLRDVDLREVMTREFGVHREAGDEEYTWRDLMGADVSTDNLLRLLNKRLI